MNGWPLVGWVVLLVSAAVGLTDGDITTVLRLTARAMLALFLAAFVASSVCRLWPSRGTKWLLRNRRYLGVGAAAAHGLHLLAIWQLARLRGGLGDPAALAPGIALYAILAAMVATSFDVTTRLVGRRAWRVLHLGGMWAIWLFLVSIYGGGVARGSLGSVPPLALLAVAATLRLTAWGRARRATSSRPSPA